METFEKYLTSMIIAMGLMVSMSLADIMGHFVYKDPEFIPNSHHYTFLFFLVIIFVVSFMGLINEESKLIARVEKS